MKTILTSLLTVIILFGSCQKELSFEKKDDVFPNTPDEEFWQNLGQDTLIAVVNPPTADGLYDMDLYRVEGPATIKVVLYDPVKWPCALLLKQYDSSNGGTIPIQESLTHEITITTQGETGISVQKADESCEGIVPYKIVRSN